MDTKSEETKLTDINDVVLDSGGNDNKKNKGKTIKVKKVHILLALIGVLIIVFILELPNIQFSLSHVTTSDAFIDGSSAIVPITPQVKGDVVRVYVRQNQHVKKGEPLFEIDRSDYIQNVNKAEARFKTVQERVKQISVSISVKGSMLKKVRYKLVADKTLEKLARENYARYYNLLRGRATSVLMFDKMRTKYRVSEANVNADIANIEQIIETIKELRVAEKSEVYASKTAAASYRIALINLKRTTVYAPCSGYVTKKNVNTGAYVMPGIPYLSIVNLHKVWVVANFKESDVHDIKIGAHVIIKVDAYPNRVFHGVVSSFQSGTGSAFSLLPPENATGNFIKVVQRVPVKIDLNRVFYGNTPLYPGLSVEPYIKIISDNSGR